MTDDQLVAKGSLACEMEVAVALARALREQQTLLQSTDIGVAFIQKRAIQRCNQQFAEIFGFPDSASLLGQASYLLHPSRDAFRALGRGGGFCWAWAHFRGLPLCRSVEF